MCHLAPNLIADNVCIKNDTTDVLVENVHFTDGHGASIGSIPDCYGCHGHVSGVIFRNCTFSGNAPMKIKTWHNTTGEVSNILFEDITLENAAEAISISGNYGGTACPCKWQADYGGPGQRTKCRSYGPTLPGTAHWPVGYVGVGGVCGPQGDATNNINIKNITFRRVKGTVQAPGTIDCRKGNPCTVSFEDVELSTSSPWVCGNANISQVGAVTPALPACLIGPPGQPGPSPLPPPPPPPAPTPPPQACHRIRTVGCFNDTDGRGGNTGMSPWLPRYIAAVHDRVTLENCAAACAGLRLRLAGIDAGNHCWCGASVATATARVRPQPECGALHCHGNPAELCGGGNRMLVYQYSCT